VFAHNGDLVGIEVHPDLKLGFHRPIGETDSEYAFCALLGRLEQRWFSNSGVPPLDQRLEIVVRFAQILSSLGMANFVYSDGDAVFAHGNKRRYGTSDEPRPPGLHALHRVCGAHSDDYCTDGLRISAGPNQQEMALVASVPLTDEAWQQVQEGEVLALRAGEISARVG
jgi:glutamine amidotransferase